MAAASEQFARQIRWRPLEIAFWLAALLPFLVTPNYLSLASQVAITALFALSLDLLVGYAGLVSLGHAAFFGFGAYTAGLIAKHWWTEPISALFVAAILSGMLGYALSHVIVRFRHLALIMLTLGFGLLIAEAANSAHDLTGGADGLQGFRVPGVLSFPFDLYGRTAYAYCLAVLFLCFLVTRRIIHSPFGLALRGIRENATRIPSHIAKTCRVRIEPALDSGPGRPLFESDSVGRGTPVSIKQSNSKDHSDRDDTEPRLHVDRLVWRQQPAPAPCAHTPQQRRRARNSHTRLSRQKNPSRQRHRRAENVPVYPWKGGE